jgi:hypothetical protein
MDTGMMSSAALGANGLVVWVRDVMSPGPGGFKAFY